MKKLLVVTVACLLAGTVVYTQRERLSLMLVERNVKERLADAVATLPDGLHVAFCGTGSPFPDPDRAAPCTLIIAGRDVVLIDAGGNAARQIARMGFSTGRINHVLLTHFHSDHIDGLGELMMTRWAQNSDGQRLQIHGPTGVAQVVDGFRTAYAADVGYRRAHHGDATMPLALAGADPMPFTVPDTGLAPVLSQGDLQISAFRVSHTPVEPAVGYLVSYRGRRVVLSGDTTPNDNLATVGQGADLLVHEALSPELVGVLARVAGEAQRPRLARLFEDITDYHSRPEDVARLADHAGIKAVALNHIVPPLPLPPLRELFLGKAPELFHGDLRIAEDGDFISLPAGGDEIIHARRWTR